MRPRAVILIGCAALAVACLPVLAQGKGRGKHQVIVINAPTPAPALASNPSPADGATGVLTTATLSWTAGSGATTHTVKFGTTNPPPTVSVAQAGTTYNPGTTTASTGYYWQVIENNSTGSNTGPVWFFTTAGGGGGTGLLSSADFTFVGYVRPERTSGVTNCNFEGERQGGLAVRKVAGVNHFLIMQVDGSDYRFAPCEFLEPSTWNTSGVCLSNCPSTTLSTAPFATLITNWGVNDDGTMYDFYHGKLGQYYDVTSTLINDCAFTGSLPALGGGCLAWSMQMTSDGVSNGLYVTYGASYGNYHDKGGLMFVTLDNASSGGHRVTTAYGPYVLESPVGSYPTDTAKTLGLWAGAYLVTMPDHTFGHGIGGPGAYQQHGSPSGPSLSTSSTCTGCTNGWPGTTTPTGASDKIASQKNYLHYYNLDGYLDATNCTLPAGQPLWAMRWTEAFPYVTEVFGGSCGQGAMEAVNPRTTTGNKGTWNETTSASAGVWIQTATKRGFLSFVSGSTNHSAGNTTACTHAHVWYCAGSGVGASGNPCSGTGGDGLSPQWECPSPLSVTGPTTTVQEARWLIFDTNTLTSVAAGTSTDYTVDASSSIFPEDTWGLPFSPVTSLIRKATSGAYYDTTTNLLYVLIPAADTVTQFGEHRPYLAVFRVAQ